ncbi:MAG: metallophosphoesterase [Spirochaetaceae bacterium]|jgi:predicted phosphodiesterase|nr:metallophosphoesterase [Spirochaetaceae bacterium]
MVNLHKRSGAYSAHRRKPLRSLIFLAKTALTAALWTYCAVSCNVDLFGFFASSDLDNRLASRNEFVLLDKESVVLNAGGAPEYATIDVRNFSLPEEYVFIAVADTHIENGNLHGLDRLKNVLDGAKFVVVLGDITQNGKRDDIAAFVNFALSLGIPCYPVLGNHDIYFDNWIVWKELIGSSSYKIDGGNTVMFILDSANGMFGGMQLDWLRKGLNGAKRHAFVFTHTNLFVSSVFDGVQITDNRERAKMVSLLKGRAEMMLMGHVHKTIIRKTAGVEYISVNDFRKGKTILRVYVSPSGIQYNFMNL